jgi:hypothetical protein
MMSITRKEHWETIYKNKLPHEVSWTQDVPQISLDFIHSFNLPKTSSIIDIGGGESKLADFLLMEGFENITVLDISSHAIEKAQKRLGKHAKKITWIESDILEFKPIQPYDCWHDRATFHFLTTKPNIQTYVGLVNQFVNKNLVMGTFSTEGPLKCSGLEITQYNESALTRCFDHFKKIECKTENHQTPFNTQQNFLFCSFEKINS